MLQRIFIFCLLSGFALPAMALQSQPDKETQRLAEKVIELERSLAILQISTATSDDYQALESQIETLSSQQKTSQQATARINFLSNLVFLMFVALLLCLFQLRRQSRQLSALSNSRQDEK
ncbi:hypothetical protein [Marinomonas pollencensis]|uniref:Uncharacterized protein n=1 Tax=Marinomonas pollencensis TaxID=491954 RepID=A0A3E0DIW5_9GAMM|nr:hypothetical protein [Marinomonas pollencensis]REG82617.1 hypothetical protein DFP81_10851 [Marinomonas pollencensis]